MDSLEHLLLVLNLRVEKGEPRSEISKAIRDLSNAWNVTDGDINDPNEPMAKLSVRWAKKYRRLLYPHVSA